MTSTLTRRTTRPRLARARLSAAAGIGCLMVATLAGCSGSGGVELGDDWAGSETFVVATMSGLTTVLGVDPDRHRAEPLLVVPQQRDDDSVLAPQIVRLPGTAADATWLLVVPRRGDAPARLYSFSHSDRSLMVAGDIEGGRTLVPDGPEGLAGIGGGADGTALRYSLRLGEDARHSVTVREDVSLGGTVDYASGGDGGVCTTVDTEAGTALYRLSPSSSSPRTWQLDGLHATALDCTGSRVTLAAQVTIPTTPSPGDDATGSGVPLHLESRDGAQIVTGGPDLVARVLDTPDGVVAAAQGPSGCSLSLLSPATGQVTSRVALDGLSTIDGIATTRHGFVVTGADRAVAVTRDLRAATTFDLPAAVTATS